MYYGKSGNVSHQTTPAVPKDADDKNICFSIAQSYWSLAVHILRRKLHVRSFLPCSAVAPASSPFYPTPRFLNAHLRVVSVTVLFFLSQRCSTPIKNALKCLKLQLRSRHRSRPWDAQLSLRSTQHKSYTIEEFALTQTLIMTTKSQSLLRYCTIVHAVLLRGAV